ncbi:unnamed protein product [Effrenium voratum]|uniref:Uncharacterized protein n=1 Tax=Effrenium voratum TaxID=2562239 RepID=A0AA36NI24_9DINO|nr:unnamed protein product [Effrenium voratum]
MAMLASSPSAKVCPTAVLGVVDPRPGSPLGPMIAWRMNTVLAAVGLSVLRMPKGTRKARTSRAAADVKARPVAFSWDPVALGGEMTLPSLHLRPVSADAEVGLFKQRRAAERSFGRITMRMACLASFRPDPVAELRPDPADGRLVLVAMLGLLRHEQFESSTLDWLTILQDP